MANELLFQAPAAGNFKAIVSKGNQVWNGAVMVATTAAAKAAGVIPLTRLGTTLDYNGSFPASLTVAGRYTVSVVDAVTPTGVEPSVGSGDLDWSGSAEIFTQDDAIIAQLGLISGYVDTEVAAIKAKTDVLPDPTIVAAVKVVTDKLSNMIIGTVPNFMLTTQALANAPAGGVGGLTTLDLAQVIPNANVAGTLGDALNAARAQGFGRWAKIGTSLILYGADNVTPVHTFTLNDALAPTARA